MVTQYASFMIIENYNLKYHIEFGIVTIYYGIYTCFSLNHHFPDLCQHSNIARLNRKCHVACKIFNNAIFIKKSFLTLLK
jgi:hypothetical protein